MSVQSLPDVFGKSRLKGASFQTPNVSLREDQFEELLKPAALLQKELQIPLVVARILLSRGISEASQARAFLFPTLREHLPDPTKIKNINQIAQLLIQAIREQEQITVFCDFDVDGLTAGSQLQLYLLALGAKVNAYVPNRFTEGYGMSLAAVETLARAGTQVLVTVDCGVTNNREIAQAKRLGMKTAIIDHHQPGEKLPDADVVVDPAQGGCPFAEYELAAAGLVWMLLIVLRKELAADKDLPAVDLPDPKDFLDLAAMGTICDMVPLVKLNRVIAFRGMEALRVSSRPGVVALKDVVGIPPNKQLSSGHISYGLGPRINAAGRLDDGTQILKMFSTKDSRAAKGIAESIDRLNKKRKAIEENVKDCCIRELVQDDARLAEPAVTVYGKEFHLGVIGIAAQRLVEEFHKPAAVMAPGEVVVDGEKKQVAKGSVRSIKGFHVSEVLQSLDSLLMSHGGHAAAGGFTVSFEKLEEFQEAFVAAARERLNPELLKPRVLADVRVSLGEIDFDLANDLARLAPFGIGNPSPLLVSEGVVIDSTTVLAEHHLRVRLRDKQCSRNAVAWRMNGHPLLRKGKNVNVAYQVELNTYHGVTSVQLNIKSVWE